MIVPIGALAEVGPEADLVRIAWSTCKTDSQSLTGTTDGLRRSRDGYASPIVVALAKHPAVESYDMSSVRIVFSGAAPLDAETAELCARHTGCRMSQGYGLAETRPVSTPGLQSRGTSNQEAITDPLTSLASSSAWLGPWRRRRTGGAVSKPVLPAGGGGIAEGTRLHQCGWLGLSSGDPRR